MWYDILYSLFYASNRNKILEFFCLHSVYAEPEWIQTIEFWWKLRTQNAVKCEARIKPSVSDKWNLMKKEKKNQKLELSRVVSQNNRVTYTR